MATYIVELTTEQERLLHEVAQHTNRTESALCAEAVSRFLESRRYMLEPAVNASGARRLSMSGISTEDLGAMAVCQYVAPDEEP